MDDSFDEESYVNAVRAVLTLHRNLRRYSKKLQCTNVSGRQLALLRHVASPGRHTVGSLASFLFISESSASGLVSKMESAALVLRRRSKRDQRVVEVLITDEGRRITEETPLGGIALLRERMKEMSRMELRAVARSISQLVDYLEEGDEKG